MPNQRSRKKASSTSRRQTKDASTNNNGRPVPPPPPPKELVQLLQRNASVLEYFTSLQENLNADVTKYKGRAVEWQRRAEQLEAQLAVSEKVVTVEPGKYHDDGASDLSDSIDLEDPRKPKEAKKGTAKRYIGKNDNVVEHNEHHSKKTKTPEAERVTEEINDDMFDVSSSSSDDDAEKDDASSLHETSISRPRQIHDAAAPQTLYGASSSRRKRPRPRSREKERQEYATLMYPQLKYALECLEQLGVSLVVENKRNQDSAPANGPSTTSDASKEGNGDAVLQENGDGTNSDNSEDGESVQETFFTLSKQKNVSSMNGKHDSGNEEPTELESHRRFVSSPDEQVATALMESLRMLVRIHIQPPQGASLSHLRSYEPFAPHNDMKQCYKDRPRKDTENESPPHPATKGLNLAFCALSIMDTYCHKQPQDDWDAIFSNATDSDEREKIYIGMQNRQSLTERILAWISSDIFDGWALSSREKRIQETVLFYEPEDAIMGAFGEDDNIQNTNNISGASFGPKSRTRLAYMAERCMYAQLVAQLNHHRCDFQELGQLIVGYISSATPSLGVEEYPLLPPILSLCVLEALLENGNSPEAIDVEADNPCWFYTTFLQRFHAAAPVSKTKPDANVPAQNILLHRTLSTCIHTVASIWMERRKSEDDRIRDVSVVELAAYDRIQKTQSCWLSTGESAFDNTMEVRKDIGTSVFNTALSSLELETLSDGFDSDNDFCQLDHERSTQTLPTVNGLVSVELNLLLFGDLSVLTRIVHGIFSRLTSYQSIGSVSDSVLYMLVILSKALCEIKRRQWDMLRIKNVSYRIQANIHEIHDQFQDHFQNLTKYFDKQHSLSISDLKLGATVTKCCMILANGEIALSVATSMFTKQWDLGENIETPDSDDAREAKRTLATIMSDLLAVGNTPSIRVINLERRTDRLQSFMMQTRRERFLLVKGGTRLDLLEKSSKGISSFTKRTRLEDGETGIMWGRYAYDGKGSAVEFEKVMAAELPPDMLLTDLVESHWRPSDLKAFDQDARVDSALVRASPSERACALSHISAWKGVAESLRLMEENTDARADKNVFSPHPENTIRLFKISGFARGAALLPENENMLPAPVCVVLEDDAVLVEGFIDRLTALLEELPRDFHFCYIGYSRPKTAPLVKYSSLLGIPTCLWYLTGYIMSLEGAKYLLQSLPVTGPIDSWMGLKIWCTNWDNIFGKKIGVGNNSRFHIETPLARKDLATVLKFRAFASLVPLCSQKIGSASSSSAPSRLNWRERDRDTDITYSGNS
eukprot:CAMPEP_0198290556 /NCGR_PEP_ID=MMETSP1449-20131203/8373_1 /TAXON_ID=420275 /ORGANISM="Attheya septentrionalis, Strain CCMP2084" /LENGTH=1277 /DNA_ID=CAMNT_0043989069 /DNA_START=178 /DNA_END=4008 /DNA_ORIENTATION=-